MTQAFKIIQIVLSILLIVSILLQQSGSGLGMAFGGGGNVYRSKRGVEKVLYWATIVLATLLCLTALFTVLYS